MLKKRISKSTLKIKNYVEQKLHGRKEPVEPPKPIRAVAPVIKPGPQKNYQVFIRRVFGNKKSSSQMLKVHKSQLLQGNEFSFDQYQGIVKQVFAKEIKSQQTIGDEDQFENILRLIESKESELVVPRCEQECSNNDDLQSCKTRQSKEDITKLKSYLEKKLQILDGSDKILGEYGLQLSEKDVAQVIYKN